MEEEAVKKISVEEYIESHNIMSKSTKTYRKVLKLAVFLIGSVVFALLAFLCWDIYKYNETAGYISIGVAILLFLFAFILPVHKMIKKPAFELDIRSKNVLKVKHYNRKLRKQIASGMVELYDSCDSQDWYSKENIENLRVSMKQGDNSIKNNLAIIIKNDIQKAAKKIIKEKCLLVLGLTAASQSEKLDSLLIVTNEIDLINKIIHLYGYRPTDEKLLRIYKNVLTSALLSYGAQGIANKFISNASNSIPIVGGIINPLIGSALDGTANAIITGYVGNQTINYLQKEFKLASLLDDVETEIDIEKEEKNVKNYVSNLDKKHKKTNK